MKCPKCQYVSFEPEPRCRHCGYGFSLADADRAAAALDEAPSPSAGLAGARPAVPDQPLRDRESRQRPVSAAAPHAPLPVPQPVPVPVPLPVSNAARTGAALGADQQFQGPFGAEPPWEPELVRTPEAPPAELPLFVKAVNATIAAEQAADDMQDAPLVRVPAEPRVPLGVRRPAPDTGAHRAAASTPPPRAASRRLGPLDRDLLEDLQRIERAERQDHAGAGPAPEGAGAVARLTAAALDAAIIGGLTAGVLWVTLRWLDLPAEQVTTLPFAPMGAFLALVGLGYLMMFTAAGGQTIGKMICGLRVIREQEAAAAPEAVTFAQAAYRVMLSLPSVLALGAGFVPALRGGHQAFHDRLAHTRVVRV